MLAVLAVLFWSTVATGFKLGLTTMTPAQLLLVASAIAFLLFGGCWFVIKPPRIRWPDFRHAAFLGITNPFLYYLILLEGYDRLPAQIAQPLNYLWALAIAILAIPILRQRTTPRLWVGMCISYAGVALLLSRGEIQEVANLDWLGIGLILTSTVLWAFYWLWQSRTEAHAIQFMTICFGVGTTFTWLYCLLTDGMPSLTPQNVLYGAWIGLLEMGITFLVWQAALNSTSHVARIAQLIFISPLISLFLIQSVLGEAIHMFTWIALPVILLGLLVVRMPSTPTRQ